MQNGRFNFNNAMNFHPPHPEIDRFLSPNPPIYSNSYSFEPQHPPQFHQPHNPSINPHPYGYGGCSDYEQRLRDEVIYLHSLWRQGPPRNPHLLKPLPTTHFKKKKPKKTQIDSGKEWPIDPKLACPSPPKEGWGEFKSRITPKFRPPSAQEQDRVLGVRVHLKGLDSCSGFFHNSDDDDDDGGADDDEEEDDYDEEEAFELFLKVFEEDENLRGYYKTKFHNGEFYCLVCGVIGNKLGRKYKDCVALVQHSVTISKTKKRVAHRAYGRIVCKVLGWDIDRLPSLPLTVLDANPVVENQSLDLKKSNEEPPQGENKNNVDVSEDKPAVAEGEGDPANTNGSQGETEDFPEAAEKENVSSVDNGCTTNEQRESGDNLPSQSINETGTTAGESQ